MIGFVEFVDSVGVVEFFEFLESIEFIEVARSVGSLESFDVVESSQSVELVSLFSRQPISLAGKAYWDRIHVGFRQQALFAHCLHTDD